MIVNNMKTIRYIFLAFFCFFVGVGYGQEITQITVNNERVTLNNNQIDTLQICLEESNKIQLDYSVRNGDNNDSLRLIYEQPGFCAKGDDSCPIQLEAIKLTPSPTAHIFNQATLEQGNESIKSGYYIIQITNNLNAIDVDTIDADTIFIESIFNDLVLNDDVDSVFCSGGGDLIILASLVDTATVKGTWMLTRPEEEAIPLVNQDSLQINNLTIGNNILTLEVDDHPCVTTLSKTLTLVDTSYALVEEETSICSSQLPIDLASFLLEEDQNFPGDWLLQGENVTDALPVLASGSYQLVFQPKETCNSQNDTIQINVIEGPKFRDHEVFTNPVCLPEEDSIINLEDLVDIFIPNSDWRLNDASITNLNLNDLGRGANNLTYEPATGNCRDMVTKTIILLDNNISLTEDASICTSELPITDLSRWIEEGYKDVVGQWILKDTDSGRVIDSLDKGLIGKQQLIFEVTDKTCGERRDTIELTMVEPPAFKHPLFDTVTCGRISGLISINELIDSTISETGVWSLVNEVFPTPFNRTVEELINLENIRFDNNIFTYQSGAGAICAFSNIKDTIKLARQPEPPILEAPNSTEVGQAITFNFAPRTEGIVINRWRLIINNFIEGDSSVIDTTGDILQYEHIFDKTGDYRLSLIAINEAGCESPPSEEKNIIVNPPTGCTATILKGFIPLDNDTICYGENIEVSVSPSLSSADATVRNYQWELRDPSGNIDISSTSNNERFQTNALILPNTWSIVVSVTDSEGCIGSDELKVNVLPKPEQFELRPRIKRILYL